MSRVDSVKVGAMKAVLPLAGTVVASDAFFPFPDGVEEAAKHGVTALIQPGGSVRDDEVIAAADRLGRRDGVHRRAAFPALNVTEQIVGATKTYIMRPVMATAAPATPAITPITGNIFLREMK